jgi:hypothetical protein
MGKRSLASVDDDEPGQEDQSADRRRRQTQPRDHVHQRGQ